MAILIGSQLKRQLALRLCLGGVLIATILGGVVFWFEIERIEDGFVAEAVEQARTLSPSLPSRLDEASAPQIQAALETFLRITDRKTLDHFTGIEIYGRDHATLAEAISPEGKAAAQVIDRSGHIFPDLGESWYFKHVVAGEIYLQVMTGLASGADGKPVGYFEGLYHISSARIAEAKNAGLRTSILKKVGAMLSELTDEQASYIGVSKAGPYKADAYRY